MNDKDIDNLSILLEKFSVDERNSSCAEVVCTQRNRMVPPVENPQRPQINWELFKSKLNNIKPYNGDSNSLNKFLTRCDQLVATYQEYRDPLMNAHVLECIQEKLIDKAELMVGNRLEINSWAALRDALVQCFSDRRDLDCLVQELTRSKPYKGEHLNDFGSRIQLIRSNVISRISNDQELTVDEKQIQANHYSKVALNTFIAGCSGTLKNNMHLKKPASLEDAIAYVAEFENFESLYGNLQDRNPPLNKSNSHPRNDRQQSYSQDVQRRHPNNYQYQNQNWGQYQRPQLYWAIYIFLLIFYFLYFYSVP